MEEYLKNTIVIIPTYNNAATVGDVIRRTLPSGLPVLVVNDGSTDSTREVLAQFPEIRVIHFPKNKGKGAALKTGLEAVTKEKFRYAVTLDSDRQHYPEDIPVFLKEIEKTPGALLVGARNLQAGNMPGKNSFANKFSNFWFRIETGKKMEDTQSGFRLYPLEKIKELKLFTGKYEFELEIIVQSAWRGLDVRNVPIRVYYPPQGERVSHFRPWRDFTRISLLNTVLVMVALLWYYPWKTVRSLTKENIRKFIRNNITHSPESNERITGAVMLGVFMGIAPVWGYQMALAFLLAHLLKLNKAITLVASNISIPPMIPFILFGSYATGARLLGNALDFSVESMSLEFVMNSLVQYLLGSIVFAVACGLLAGLVCYTLLVIFRKPKTAGL
jgi:glycosyltransferase involved in cell wall biosynthesis